MLILQTAPQKRTNAKQIELFCHQVIQGELSMTSRFTRGVFDAGVRTGSVILNKGASIARFATNLFSSKK